MIFQTGSIEKTPAEQARVKLGKNKIEDLIKMALRTGIIE